MPILTNPSHHEGKATKKLGCEQKVLVDLVTALSELGMN